MIYHEKVQNEVDSKSGLTKTPTALGGMHLSGHKKTPTVLCRNVFVGPEKTPTSNFQLHVSGLKRLQLDSPLVCNGLSTRRNAHCCRAPRTPTLYISRAQSNTNMCVNIYTFSNKYTVRKSYHAPAFSPSKTSITNIWQCGSSVITPALNIDRSNQNPHTPAPLAMLARTPV